MKLSVIIPVYNGEKTVEGAIGSIVASPPSFSFEILVIDDGSTDGTGALLRKLEEENPSLRVISQENAGPAAARNRGITEAKGEYVLFLDCDDRLVPNALDLAVARTEQEDLDILIYGFYWVRGEEEIPYCYEDLFLTEEEKKKHLASLYRANLLNQGWGKVFRTEFLKENNLLFPHLLWGEDRLFFFSALEKGKRIGVSSLVLYRYIQQETSLISRFSEEKAKTCAEIHKRILSLAKKWGADDPESLSIYSYMYQKSVLSVLFTLFSPSCPLKGMKKLKGANKILSTCPVKDLPPSPRDAGLLFHLSEKVLKSGSPFFSLLMGKAMVLVGKIAPKLFRRAKHAYNKGEEK